MKISLFNVRITIQKNTVSVDAIGNHKAVWEDYFSCAAYAAASSYKQGETETAGIISSEDGLVFTIRYCSEAASIDATHYRVLLGTAIYNITSVDMMNFGKKSIKLSCTREERG